MLLFGVCVVDSGSVAVPWSVESMFVVAWKLLTVRALYLLLEVGKAYHLPIILHVISFNSEINPLSLTHLDCYRHFIAFRVLD